MSDTTPIVVQSVTPKPSVNLPFTPQAPTQNKPLMALLSVLLAIIAFFIFYVIIKLWPANANVASNAVIFGHVFRMEPDQRYMLLMPLGGALGATIHLIISYTAYVGNRSFVTSWISWYALRPFVGAGLALFFYLLLRGGILTYTPTTTAATTDSTAVKDSINKSLAVLKQKLVAQSVAAKTTDTLTTATAIAGYKKDSTARMEAYHTDSLNIRKNAPAPKETPASIPLNPYGMLAIACMVGMFSKEAAKKLEETFITLFNVRDDARIQYGDKLHNDNRPGVGGGDMGKDPNDIADNDTGNLTKAIKGPSGAAASDIDDVLTDPDATSDDADNDISPKG